MSDISATDYDLKRRAARAIARLQQAAGRPPCAVFLGEANSGKTTAANSLLGDGLLPTAVISNTRTPTLVRYSPHVQAVAVTTAGARIRLAAESALPAAALAVIEVGLPNPLLQRLEILDTPAGFDAETLPALPGLPALRIPVWCTPATQAWKESERRAWTAFDSAITRHGVLTVTSLDRVTDHDAVQRLMSRLGAEAMFHFRACATSAVRDGKIVSDPTRLTEHLDDVLPRLADRLATRRKATIARLTSRLARLSDLPARWHDGAAGTPVGSNFEKLAS